MKYLFRSVTIEWLVGFLFSLILCSQNLEAQVNSIAIGKDQHTPPRNKQYRTWISLNREPFTVSGYLTEVSESSVLVLSHDYGVLDVPVIDIDTIRNNYNIYKYKLDRVVSRSPSIERQNFKCGELTKSPPELITKTN